jgi:hypothetical protein
MVQGLGFLTKKSWHTKNLDNQEKVWMAEQKKEAEGRKTKELARQIQQEREQEDLDKISGKSTRKDRGIDWMYTHGPNSEMVKEDEAKRNEEFLLGKEYVADGATTGDFDNGDQKEGIYNVMSKTMEEQEAPPLPSCDNQEPSVKDRNEQFRMRVEDPMFHVKQQQREKYVQHEKTKELYERVVGYNSNDGDDSREDEKKRRKDRKKNRKSDRRSSSSRKRRSRSSSSERHHHSSKRYSKHMSSRRRSRSRSEERYRSRREDRHHYHRRHRYDRDEDRHSRKNRDYYDDYHNDRRYHNDPTNDRKQEGYGLRGADTNTDTTDLGPNKELLQKKRQEREAQRRRMKEVSTSRNRSTGEERARALAEMQSDARKREDSRHHLKKYYDNEDDTITNKSRKGASFLSDMSKQTHGITGNASKSLSERLRQNRHTNQRSHESFL